MNAEKELIGWWNPISRRFAYDDERVVWLHRAKTESADTYKERVAAFHVPVYVEHYRREGTTPLKMTLKEEADVF